MQYSIDKLIKVSWCKHETNIISKCEDEKQMSALVTVSLTDRGSIAASIYFKQTTFQTKHIELLTCALSVETEF